MKFPMQEMEELVQKKKEHVESVRGDKMSNLAQLESPVKDVLHYPCDLQYRPTSFNQVLNWIIFFSFSPEFRDLAIYSLRRL